MQPYTSSEDSRRSYDFGCYAQRLRLVVAGDVVPRLDEPVELILLAKMGEGE